MRKRNSTITRKSITPAQFRNFIFMGRSVFTLENNETNNYLTFQIKEVKKNNKVVPNEFTVQCKSLGDKAYGYQFLGFLNTATKRFNTYKRTPNTFIGFTVFFWLMQNLERLEDFTKLAIYHEGRCAKCSLPLTVPESIDSGIGPECKRKMLQKSIDKLKDLGLWNASLSYDDNVINALKADPSLWTLIHVPEGIKPQEEFKVHRMFEKMGIF